MHDTLKVSLTITLFVGLCCASLAGCTAKRTPDAFSPVRTVQPSDNAVNINTASAEELEKIPYIGEKLARKIVAHRETHGVFRKPEQLMLIQGISDKRFRQIRHLIRTD